MWSASSQVCDSCRTVKANWRPRMSTRATTPAASATTRRLLSLSTIQPSVRAFTILNIKIAVLGLRGSHYGRAKPLIGVIGPDSTALWRTRKRSPLVDKTALNFNLSEVSADKAYLGANNMLTTLRHGAIP